MLELIRESKRRSICVILINHPLVDAFAVCDRVIALRRGLVAADECIAQSHMSRVVAHPIGVQS